MDKMNRRMFLNTTGKIALASATAFSIEALLDFPPNLLKLALASSSQSEFNVYNDVNPNTKEMVAYIFEDCISKDLAPSIFYKTSKPMVAVAEGTVSQIFDLSDVESTHWHSLKKEKNDAKGIAVEIRHGLNYISLYLPLMQPKVKFGQKVKRDQVLGYPDERWNMPRLLFLEMMEASDPNNYGVNHGFMTYWEGKQIWQLAKTNKISGMKHKSKF